MISLYLLVNISAVIIPFIFSFHPKLNFYRQWIYFFPACIITAVIFCLWDGIFTHLGVWSFNEKYLSGLKIFNLPVEEVLFFICIPYACVFTYFCLKVLIPGDPLRKAGRVISVILIIVLSVIAALYTEKNYTFYTFTLLALMILFVQFVLRSKWLSFFYFTYLILLIPFFIVNGILTGTGLEEPVVIYNDTENLGIRLGTIPVEDIFYGMLLILCNVLLYNFLKKKYPSKVVI